MKKVLIILAAVLGLVVVSAAGFYVWAGSATTKNLSRTFTTHTVDFPIPFPLFAAEIKRRKLTPAAADSVAKAEALARGKHLMESRYGCMECHGEDLGGGKMLDAAPIGKWYGPNLTAGAGSRTPGFSTADWDRIVRHGILPSGHPAVMPAQDFQLMSDQELSDVITLIRSYPAVDRTVPPISFGPVAKMLIATGKMRPSADVITTHDAPHAPFPPATAATLEFGRHIANGCTGCHSGDLAGGPIVGGDPAWPPAGNLTPHDNGLGKWTYEQFVTAMRQAKRPDGSALKPPMSDMPKFANKMLDVELEALWLYLRSLPPVPSRK